jgi:hypothetical protein
MRDRPGNYIGKYLNLEGEKASEETRKFDSTIQRIRQRGLNTGAEGEEMREKRRRRSQAQY